MLGLYRALCWGCTKGLVGVVQRVVLGWYGGLCWGCIEGCIGVLWRVVLLL